MSLVLVRKLWRFHLQAAMSAFVVVYGNSLCEHLLRDSQVRQCSFKTKFIFEDSIYSFGDGVLVRVVLLCRAQDHAVVLREFSKLWRAVLNAAIAVVYYLRIFVRPVFKRHFQSLLYQCRTHVRVEAVAHDFLGIRVGYQSQVSVAFLELDVSDVAYPNLFGSGRGDVLNPIGRLEKHVS